MLTYDEALQKILASAAVMPAERIRIEDTLGAVLAKSVGANSDIPPWRNSAMDGFAARYEDFASGTQLKIEGFLRAGDNPNQTYLNAGSAVKIATGAHLPPWVDTVVPIEDCTVDGDQLTVTQPVREGQCVRQAGQDAKQGSIVLEAGREVTPAGIAICVAGGQDFVEVHRRPKIGIIATGNELTPPGKFLDVGCIYNSNAYGLAAQVTEAGGIVDKNIHAVDDPDAIRAAFDACAACDVILTSGGVSVGEYDLVKDIFEERGTLDFWRVAIRPGKPLAFGRTGNALFFGLPGNPVSSMVTFELFVRPTIRKMMGHTRTSRPMIDAILDEDIEHGAGRQSFVRGTIRREVDGYHVKQSGGQDSGMLHAMVAANCLIMVPADVDKLAAGMSTAVMVLDASGL